MPKDDEFVMLNFFSLSLMLILISWHLVLMLVFMLILMLVLILVFGYLLECRWASHNVRAVGRVSESVVDFSLVSSLLS